MTRFSAPILTWFSAPVLTPAPGLGSAPVLTVCCLLGDVSGGKIIEEGKWTDFVVYWGSEGSDSKREKEKGGGEFKAEHGEDWKVRRERTEEGGDSIYRVSRRKVEKSGGRERWFITGLPDDGW